MPYRSSLHSRLTVFQTGRSKARGWLTMFYPVSFLSEPEKGTLELISAKSITPRLQMSALESLGKSNTTSGAMKPIVPATFLIHSSSLRWAAIPKSPIRTLGVVLVSLRKMLRCLRSRWTILKWWMSWTPRAICEKI